MKTIQEEATTRGQLITIDPLPSRRIFLFIDDDGQVVEFKEGVPQNSEGHPFDSGPWRPLDIKKLRRRVEDRLRKSTIEAVVEAAIKIGVPLT